VCATIPKQIVCRRHRFVASFTYIKLGDPMVIFGAFTPSQDSIGLGSMEAKKKEGILPEV
jgi:hypothetical protein